MATSSPFTKIIAVPAAAPAPARNTPRRVCTTAKEKTPLELLEDKKTAGVITASQFEFQSRELARHSKYERAETLKAEFREQARQEIIHQKRLAAKGEVESKRDHHKRKLTDWDRILLSPDHIEEVEQRIRGESISSGVSNKRQLVKTAPPITPILTRRQTAAVIAATPPTTREPPPLPPSKASDPRRQQLFRTSIVAEYQKTHPAGDYDIFTADWFPIVVPSNDFTHSLSDPVSEWIAFFGTCLGQKAYTEVRWWGLIADYCFDGLVKKWPNAIDRIRVYAQNRFPRNTADEFRAHAP